MFRVDATPQHYLGDWSVLGYHQPLPHGNTGKGNKHAWQGAVTENLARTRKSDTVDNTPRLATPWMRCGCEAQTTLHDNQQLHSTIVRRASDP